MALDPEDARALGALTQSIGDLDRRMLAQFAEFMRQLADSNSQAHEIKHSAENMKMALAILGERLGTHIVTDERNQLAAERNQRDTIEAVKENRAVAQTAMDELKGQVKQDMKSHSDALADDITEIKGNQLILLTWRNKVLGGVALAGIIVAIFGKAISDFIASVFHHW